MKEELANKRHTLAHLLAAAVLDLYPNTQRAIGPAIENGFYFDFAFETPLSEEDLPKIEARMRELLPSWTDTSLHMLSKEQALSEYLGNPFKGELIEEFSPNGEELSFYKNGEYWDLCKGGHVEHPAQEINPESFTLTHIAGAYWRGNEQNPMLTRIYGLAFETKEELLTYQEQLEEAKKRDHRKLGAELDLFTVSPLIGSGLPLLKPKGMLIREEISNYLWELHKSHGYSKVWTPHIAKVDLYETSGHAAKFGDELFRVSGKEENFIMKPMNCPHHMQIFADNQFSYRDMPVRYFEPATIYRDEKSGQLSGLTRVRAITQDDGHLFCRMSQIKEEASIVATIIKEFYGTVGMLDNYWVRLSTRGEDKSQYIGTEEAWDTAENMLEEVAKANNLNYKPGPGEAAFYGPKLDFMFQDAIGREWQLATIQCDFNLPERFDLSFINENGEKERPVVIHRAISGSLERFMGVMIEHFAGSFPLWLSPVQVALLPVSDKFEQEIQTIAKILSDNNVRVQIYSQNDSLGKRIRTARTEKIPYLIVIGEKEIETGNVTLEGRNDEKISCTSIHEAVEMLTKKIRERSL